MNIFHISLNNLKRRKTKMLFLMLGLIVGVATVIALTNIIQAMQIELGDRIDEFGANAIILPRTEGMEMHSGNNMGSDLYLDVQKLTMDDIPKIYESSVAEYINIVSPKLVGAVEAGDQKTIIVGIEPKEEFFQKPWYSLAQVAPGENIDNLAFMELPADAIILGSSAAGALNKQIGDQITINDDTFHIYGILDELGSEEDGLIFANLAVVQQLLNRPGELSMIEVSAYCTACPIEEIAMGLEEAMPNGRVTPLRQAALFREETIDNFSSFGIALSVMVLIIAGLVVLTTMLSSVNERTREIGIFRAIGFRKSHIIQIIILEVVMVSIVGGLIGYFTGSLMAKYAGPHIAQIQGDIPLQLDLLLPAIILSTLLATITTIYPATKAAKLNPAEALRFI